jgi:hypothetical protein
MAFIVSHSREFQAGLKDRLERRMFIAMVELEGRVKRLISTGQPVRRTKSGRLIGLDPSRPFEPPHVLTGRLRQSIKGDVTRAGDFIVGRVGSNVEYARALEFGYAPRNLDPRPYLRPSFRDSIKRIASILRGGSGR